MAWPDHYRVRFEGTLGTNADEIFSIGYNLARLDSNDEWFPGDQNNLPDPLDYARNQALPFIRQVMSSGGAQGIGTHVKITAIKVNRIGPDGRYTDTTTSHTLYADQFGTPVVGQASGVVLPWQVALAVTTTTDRQRGLASKGRLFLPGLVAVVGNDGRLPLAVAQAWSSGMAQAFALARASIAGGSEYFTPCVVSPGGVTGPAAVRPITGVRVGRVLDTQRRRRSELDEDHQLTAVSY